jgi:tRNA G18 (ribose-2'-O)-methylase SpoU
MQNGDSEASRGPLSQEAPAVATAGIRQLRGADVIERVLAAGAEIGLLLVDESSADLATSRLLATAHSRGIPVRTASAAVMRRMTSPGAPTSVLALEGRRPSESLAEVMRRTGVVWCLAGVAYPTNAGVAMRTAEGSGADAIVIDAQFDHVGRRTAVRASMRADWYMPVHWEPASTALHEARACGRRIIGVENTGACEPWDLDLTVPSLMVIGGESAGVPPDILAQCDATVRVPMGGFIPSYNLQIAVGVVGAERLRQLRGAGRA